MRLILRLYPKAKAATKAKAAAAEEGELLDGAPAAPADQSSLLEAWRAAPVCHHQLTRPEQQKGGENQPIAAKRANGAKVGAANGRASAVKRQTKPQLPSSLATGCLHCGRDTAGRWHYGGKVCDTCAGWSRGCCCAAAADGKW